MTQEDKYLLLKVLCAMLPYEVKLDNGLKLRSIDTLTQIVSCSGSDRKVDYVKPYLRPMSSMTEEEKTEYHKQVDIDLGRTAEVLREQIETGTFNTENMYTPQYCHIDWLNANHFDYRGLIEMGLALEAPEGMYKTE